MHFLYMYGFARVIILPTVPDSAENNTLYSERGWCFFKLAVSGANGRILNYRSENVAMLLNSEGMPLSSKNFFAAFATKQFTNNGDATIVNELYRKVTQNQCWNMCLFTTIYLALYAVGIAVTSYLAYLPHSAYTPLNYAFIGVIWLCGICPSTLFYMAISFSFVALDSDRGCRCFQVAPQ